MCFGRGLFRNSGSLFAGLLVALLLVVGTGSATEAGDRTLRGTVEMADEGSTQPLYVLMEDLPKDVAETFGPTAKIEIKDKAFRPGVFSTWTGRTVTLKNLDNYFHDITLRPLQASSEEAEPTAQYQFVPKREVTHTFEQANVLRGTCNPHPAMNIYVLVRPSPHLGTRVKEDGSFLLTVPDDLEGAFPVKVWHPERGFSEGRTVELSGEEPPRIELSYSE